MKRKAARSSSQSRTSSQWSSFGTERCVVVTTMVRELLVAYGGGPGRSAGRKPAAAVPGPFGVRGPRPLQLPVRRVAQTLSGSVATQAGSVLPVSQAVSRLVWSSVPSRAGRVAVPSPHHSDHGRS
ncbi:hypothetical protein Scani_44470 [Streptomyces caniferus]|uniref:Uncharacterized protein n=1 Tax=Streptomyces caniferus TaxID=285557 RepID=A0A640SA99_9ACTN|nr:hypothetical protein Scani_44470 [Streptomyces caniferus]